MVDEDELLVQALGDVGALLGGAAGTKAAARRMRKNIHETRLNIPMPPESALSRIEEIFEREGQLIEAQQDPMNGPSRVIGIVGSGFRNLNPAVVTVTIANSESGTLVNVRGVAKEGIIKQRGGRSAAERIVSEMEQWN